MSVTSRIGATSIAAMLPPRSIAARFQRGTTPQVERRSPLLLSL
jgi:hypothetical protein